MTLLREPERDDQQLARYLLGQLTDEEADRIDEQSISEEGVAWRLREVEDELVDAYVTGELRGETLQRFRWFYLSSARRIDKVRFAQLLLRAAADREKNEGFWGSRRWAAVWQQWATPLAWSAGLAAALTLVASGALLQQSVQLRQELRTTRADSATLDRQTQDLQRQLAEQRSATARATTNLARARAALADAVPQQPSGPSKGIASPAAAPLGAAAPIALVLLPQSRAVGPPATLALPPGATQVAIQLQLEFNDFVGYRVALEHSDTEHVIWWSRRLAARSVDGTSRVSIVLPASLLKPQYYVIELMGVAANGGTEMVGSYAFRVLRI
jgi:hypothetical protein